MSDPTAEAEQTADAKPDTQRDQAGPGPGTELQNVLPWLDDSEQVRQINDWGAAGSLTHFESIKSWLIEQSAAVFDEPLSPKTATSLVQTAIKQFHKKFPEGVTTDDDHVD